AAAPGVLRPHQPAVLAALCAALRRGRRSGAGAAGPAGTPPLLSRLPVMWKGYGPARIGGASLSTHGSSVKEGRVSLGACLIVGRRVLARRMARVIQRVRRMVTTQM